MSYVGVLGVGVTWMIFESTMKHYPNSLVDSSDMHHLKTAPCPDYLVQLRSGLMIMSQIAGEAKFP